MLQACKELGTAFVVFSPVARGFLCGQQIDVAALDAKDIRRAMPRFLPDNYAANLKLLPEYNALAQDMGCSPSQLALAWLLAQDAHLLPIPGTKRVKYLEENAEARGLLRLQGPPRLFEKRKNLLEDFYRVAGSKKNLARIQEWYEDSPELHRALAGLKKNGALDVGEV